MEKLTSLSVTPLLPVAVCLMAGITVGSWWSPGFPMLYVLMAAIATAFACRRWAVMQTVAILVCCVALGMTLVQVQGKDNEDIHGRELHGVVMSEPAERPKTIGVDILIPSNGRLLRCYLWKEERSRALKLGDAIVICCNGQAREAAPTVNKGIHTGGTALTFVHRNEWYSGGNALQQMSRWQRTRLWFLKQRHKLLERYRDFYTDDTYAVLAAMTLGDKSAQTNGLRETFAISGASHILAISGLHIGIVYMLLTWIMLGRRRFWLSQVLTVSAIWAFAMLTGLSASVTRAATMITIYALFAERGGRSSPINVLCFAAIVILVADVQTLFDIGFQLSFSAVLAILLFMPLLQKLYQPNCSILRWIWKLCLMSLSAQMGVAPLKAYYFGRFSTYFLLTNLLVIPAATFILYGALIALLFPPASVALLWVVQQMNSWLRLIASLPGASIDDLHPTKIQVLLTYVFIILCYLIMRKVVPLNRINSAKNIQKRN